MKMNQLDSIIILIIIIQIVIIIKFNFLSVIKMIINNIQNV